MIIIMVIYYTPIVFTCTTEHVMNDIVILYIYIYIYTIILLSIVPNESEKSVLELVPS